MTIDTRHIEYIIYNSYVIDIFSILPFWSHIIMTTTKAGFFLVTLMGHGWLALSVRKKVPARK